MDIKTLLGDAWREGMTIEDIDQALADRTLVDPATLPKTVNKDMFDKTASELAKLKKELAEVKTASMTEADRLKLAQEEAAQLKAQYQKELAKVKAREVFAKAGLTDEEFSPLLDGIVSDNEEMTLTLANQVVNMVSAQKAMAERTVKEQLLKDTPKPPKGDKANLTPEERAKIELAETAKSAPKLEDRVKAQLALNPLPETKG